MGIKELEPLRHEIDALDEEIVRLLNERADRALQIGLIKRRLGIQIYSPEREDEIFRLVQKANSGKLSDGAVRRLFERIIDESRRLERETHGDLEAEADVQDESGS